MFHRHTPPPASFRFPRGRVFPGHTHHITPNFLALLHANVLEKSDEDLLMGTLHLLSQLTKSAVYRGAVYRRERFLRDLTAVLLENYSHPFASAKVLLPMCAVLGQLANDPDIRYLFLNAVLVDSSREEATGAVVLRNT